MIQKPTKDLSVIVPAYNEAESLPELVDWVDRVVKAHHIDAEIWIMDDGSTDETWEVVQSLKNKYSIVRGVKFRRNYGKAAALQTGFNAAAGSVVITMDADLQDSPDEIPELYKMIKSGKYDLVSGWKKKRYDPISKTIPTKLFNSATRSLSGIQLHDFNCGLKAYRFDVVKNIQVSGEMHRYIPVIAKWQGFHRITEKVVEHRVRKYGVTKFGLERFINGFLDLLSITFVGKFGKRPMHLFGTLGSLFFIFGFGILIYLSIAKIMYTEYGIATRPLFYFGIVALIIGVQLFLAGFLAELMIRHSAVIDNYQVEDEL